MRVVLLSGMVVAAAVVVVVVAVGRGGSVLEELAASVPLVFPADETILRTCLMV